MQPAFLGTSFWQPVLYYSSQTGDFSENYSGLDLRYRLAGYIVNLERFFWYDSDLLLLLFQIPSQFVTALRILVQRSGQSTLTSLETDRFQHQPKLRQRRVKQVRHSRGTISQSASSTEDAILSHSLAQL